jgi:drug/metabolite transporter (DMT)-like permease
MAKKFSVNPTLAGASSVLIWGSALPIAKVVEDQIGLLAFMGFTYGAMVAFGVIHHSLRRRPLLEESLFRNPYFYARWLFFVLHEGLLISGIYIVQKRHMPFVILINYLWPTAIILCSVLLAAVKITRWWAFLLGSLIVILSMLPEILGSAGLASDLFSRRGDCLAYLVVLIGAISWGMYSALSRREGDATGGSSVLPIFQATLGLALPISFLPGMATWARLTPVSALLLVAYCFLLFLAYGAWDLGMRQGNVVVLSLFADLIPWLSLAATNLMLHIDIGRNAVFSAGVLVLGATLARYGTLQKMPLFAAYDELGR